ncbi:hypothetical protein BS47DRAFT_1363387 [Hydnum rufescens UP504]|uniref:Uncharacterized protein n=1 Tax=Hydnum rufescens UP504 TaxID=1448309 RepID=A0A9P6AUD4_9AGAM|nr:hypothetical protein BS47DRAFT_1363387 [Hydnum rufescens UP504]
MAHVGEIQESLKEQIKSAPGKVSLTFEVDWELQSELISFTELPGSHSGANMAAHIFDLTKDMMTPAKLGHITSDNASVNDTAMKELEGLLVVASVDDWGALENRVHCMLHTINLAQGAFIKGLSTAIPGASFNTNIGNPEDDEGDIINLITSMDEADSTNPFPTGSLLFKIHAFIVKCCQDVRIKELELITYVVTHWGSWLSALNPSSMRVVVSQDLDGLNNILTFIQEADLVQQQFSGKSTKLMTKYYNLSDCSLVAVASSWRSRKIYGWSRHLRNSELSLTNTSHDMMQSEPT